MRREAKPKGRQCGKGTPSVVQRRRRSLRRSSTQGASEQAHGILAGAFSGAVLGARLTEALAAVGIGPWLAEPLGYGLVIGAITYLSVVIGANQCDADL